MVAELANYIIFQNPAQSISAAGSAFDWTLQFNIKGNTVFWPQPKDSIANNLFKDNVSITNPLPSYLPGIQQDPGQDVGVMKNAYETAKVILRKASSHPLAGGMARSAAGHAMNFMAGPGSQSQRMIDVRAQYAGNDDTNTSEPVVIKADYLTALERAFDAINDISVQNPSFNISDDLKRFAQELDRVERWKDRLVPATPREPDSDSDESIEESIMTDRIQGGTAKKTRSK